MTLESTRSLPRDVNLPFHIFLRKHKYFYKQRQSEHNIREEHIRKQKYYLVEHSTDDVGQSNCIVEIVLCSLLKYQITINPITDYQFLH